MADAANISEQQVRNYEKEGFLPPVPRSKSGYRLYAPIHLAALKTTRALVVGYGWKQTRAILRAVHSGDLTSAFALIDARHAELHRARHRIEQTLAALEVIASQSIPAAMSRRQRLRVGAAAAEAGVRVSALRFWEEQGLLAPQREQTSGYRLYDDSQMRRLRVVVLLREAGYPFEVIHATLDELTAGAPDKAIAAAERKRSDLARSSRDCLEALALLHTYLREFRAAEYEAL